MKKLKSFLVCFTALLLLCSCSKTQNSLTEISSEKAEPVTKTTTDNTDYEKLKEETKTVTVDGLLYRNGFQGNLVLTNFDYGDDPVLETEKSLFYRVEGTEIDLIYDISVMKIGASDAVYCRDEQWIELYKYYSDTNNFTYQCIINERGGEFRRIPVDNIDMDKLNELTDFCDKNSYDPFSFFSKPANTRKVSTKSLGKKEYRFVTLSKDGLYSHGAASFFILDGKLVFEYYATMNDGKTTIVDVPDELSNYFVALVNELQTT